MTPTTTPPQNGCIGVFDSGLGGLSILAALRERLPAAPLCYVGDSAHAPYGERPASDVVTRCRRIVGHLRAQGAALIVVACNTATALAIEQLRAEWPALPIVGVEPGVKPAVALTRIGRIALMVTPATATSDRLKRLIDRHGAGVHCHVQPCKGLAGAIEREPEDSAAVQSLVRQHCDAVKSTGADTVVLGCTHYPLVRRSIAAALGNGITLIDTSRAVAERVAVLWARVSMSTKTMGSLALHGTGDLQPMQALIDRTASLAGNRVRRLMI